jgi:DNA-binding NarL/FixJ family response regulator
MSTVKPHAMLKSRNEIRVAFVDDHETMLFGMRAVCEAEGLQVVALVATVDELLAKLGAETECDVVALDLALNDGTKPADNVSRLIAAGAKVLIYSSGDNKRDNTDALRAGAAALIKKSESSARLVEAIQLVASDIEVNNVETLATIDADEHFDAKQLLTDRELEVLKLYASGFTMKAVAAQLTCKPSTVKEHIDRVRGKYAAVGRPMPDKANLVLLAVEAGLIAEQL